MIEALDTIEGLDDDQARDTQLIFDPVEFMREHPDPRIEDFQLGEASLRDWAIQGTAIRNEFKNRAEIY